MCVFFYIFHVIHFLDVRNIQNRYEYLIDQKDGMPAVIVSSAQGFAEWPKLIFDYLESLIYYERIENQDSDAITEIQNAVVQPMNISRKFIHCCCVFFKS